MKIFIPGDSAAQSVGADLVAVAIAAEAAKRNIDVQIIRNGTRGALWLEPLVEVEKDGKRIGFSNVSSDDAAAVLDGTHASIGDVDSFEWLASQDRVTYKRVGIIDPLSIADYEAHGGFKGLARAQSMSQAEIVAEVTESGLQVFLQVLNGRPLWKHLQIRNTSAAMLTKVIAEHLPIAFLWKAIHLL